MASKSCWSRCPPITLSAATRDRRHRQGDDPYAADPCVATAGQLWINMQTGDGLQPVRITGRKSPRRGSTCVPAAACKQGLAGAA